MKTLKQYKNGTDGNVAMMFAISSLMLLTGIGAAVDLSNISREKSMLQAQVDAGVLAAATAEVNRADSSEAQKESRMEAANQVALVNGYDLAEYTPTLTLHDTTVELTGQVDYEPFFGRILGIDNLVLEATAESGLPGAVGVNVVLVLDNTTSMRVEGKLNALKLGAVNLVDAIEESGSDTKIGLVPFARYVQIDQSNLGATWLDVPASYITTREGQQATHTGGTCSEIDDTREVDGVTENFRRTVCEGQTTTYETVTNDLVSQWEGCVGTRPPPYSERDADYSHPVPGLLNRYAQEVTGLTFDRRTYCPAEIVELSTEYEAMRNAINGMYTTDETYLPTGLIWGQRVLSPGVPFDNAQAAGDPVHKKIMILMTDGINTTEIQQDTDAQTYLHAPPFIGDIDDDEVATAANAATSRMCQNAKDAGTDIYTIAFKVTDPTTKAMLRTCATSPDQALTADSNVALVNEFSRLASALEQDVRLIR